MSADLKERLKRLAGVPKAEGSQPATVVHPAPHPSPKVAAVSSWIQDMQDVEDADEEADVEGLSDEDEDSDIPDHTHREPVASQSATPSPTITELVAEGNVDDLARKVAERVVFLLRDALNHLPL